MPLLALLLLLTLLPWSRPGSSLSAQYTVAPLPARLISLNLDEGTIFALLLPLWLRVATRLRNSIQINTGRRGPSTLDIQSTPRGEHDDRQ